MRTVEGDLIALGRSGAFDVIVHGCNTMHVMGAGLAAQIRRQFPAAYEADLATAYADPAKLGTCSFARIETAPGRSLVVVNAYTQLEPSTGEPGRVDVDYEAVRRALLHIKADYTGLRIGLPQIGAGLAGGDWPRIRSIIAETLAAENVTIVEFNGAR
ncbi:MAG: macro domain-containing protein [Proteobacteria bacterium]|nr:macro domain-containing protein [Pseudomonadota bacterium]